MERERARPEGGSPLRAGGIHRVIPEARGQREACGGDVGVQVPWHRLLLPAPLTPLPGFSVFLLVGAPKANTTQPGIVEGGQVLKCDWSSQRRCQPIEFDATGKAAAGPLAESCWFFKNIHF